MHSRPVGLPRFCFPFPPHIQTFRHSKLPSYLSQFLNSLPLCVFLLLAIKRKYSKTRYFPAPFSGAIGGRHRLESRVTRRFGVSESESRVDRSHDSFNGRLPLTRSSHTFKVLPVSLATVMTVTSAADKKPYVVFGYGSLIWKVASDSLRATQLLTRGILRKPPPHTIKQSNSTPLDSLKRSKE